MTIRPILAAVDLGDASDEAIRQAEVRARAANVPLVVCQVVPEQTMMAPFFAPALVPVTVDVDVGAETAANLTARVSRLTRRAPSEVDVRVLRGVPYAAIVEEAERIDASLIVVGSHDRTGVIHALLGSVAERTIRYAPCPVLVARPRSLTGNVLVATDFSDPSLPAMRAAVEEAERIGGRVIAMHCVDVTEVAWTFSMAEHLTDQAVAEMCRSARAQLAGGLEAVGGTGECIVMKGSPAAAIVEAAETCDAEIVVIGTRGKTGLARVALGSVAERVVRDVGRATLVVRVV